MILLKTVLDYHRRGWCIIPIVAGTKVPPKGFRWKRYQAERPDEATVRGWFSNGERRGVAVVLGGVSGGLICRDFDQMGSYERWMAEHPDLARKLPTVETGRPGRHVYATADTSEIRQASPTGAAIIDLRDGKLRGGGYCLLPPSPYENGTIRYRWVVPLREEVPAIDLASAGFLVCNRESREDRGDQKTLGAGVWILWSLRTLCCTSRYARRLLGHCLQGPGSGTGCSSSWREN